MSNSDDDLFASMSAADFARAKGPSPEAFRAALIAADAAYRGEPAPDPMTADEIARRVAEVRQSMRGRSAGWDNVNSCRSWADVHALIAALDEATVRHATAIREERDRLAAERDALRAELAAARSATLDEAIAVVRRRQSEWARTGREAAHDEAWGTRLELEALRDSVSPPRSPTSEEP